MLIINLIIGFILLFLLMSSGLSKSIDEFDNVFYNTKRLLLHKEPRPVGIIMGLLSLYILDRNCLGLTEATYNYITAYLDGTLSLSQREFAEVGFWEKDLGYLIINKIPEPLTILATILFIVLNYVFKMRQNCKAILMTFAISFLGVGEILPFLSVSAAKHTALCFFWCVFWGFIGKTLYLKRYIKIRNNAIKRVTGTAPTSIETGKGAFSFFGLFCFASNGFIGWMNLPRFRSNNPKDVIKVETAPLFGMLPFSVITFLLLPVMIYIPIHFQWEDGNDHLAYLYFQFFYANFTISAFFVPLIQLLPLPWFAGANIAKAMSHSENYEPPLTQGKPISRRMYACILYICSLPPAFLLTLGPLVLIDEIMRTLFGVL